MTELGEKRWGIISKKEETYKRCPECGQEYWSRIDKDYPTCRTCGVKVGKTYTNYRGYTFVRLAEDDPYYPMAIWLSLMGDGWVRTSRLVMAQHLGRCLEEDEGVWHRDNNKDNDAIDNLIIRKPKPEKVVERANKRVYDEGHQDGYKAGYDEGYEKCFQEYKEFKGDSITVVESKRKSEPIENSKRELPKPAKKATREEASANLEYWQEKAKERRKR